jgi:hypothetical protein
MHCVSTFFNLSFLGTLPSGPQLLLRVDPKRRKAKLKLEIGKNLSNHAILSLKSYYCVPYTQMNKLFLMSYSILYCYRYCI